MAGGDEGQARVTAFAPLRVAHYRRLWAAMVVSSFGTFLQLTVAPWLMQVMTGSPLLVSLVTTALFLAIEFGATSIVNIKVGRVGGIVEAVRVRDTSRALGVPVWCGGMLETGVGLAVNVALAALDGFEFPGDISPSQDRWAEDLTEPFTLTSGHIEVPARPGIGRAPRPEMLRTAEVARVDLR